MFLFKGSKAHMEERFQGMGIKLIYNRSLISIRISAAISPCSTTEVCYRPIQESE